MQLRSPNASHLPEVGGASRPSDPVTHSGGVIEAMVHPPPVHSILDYRERLHMFSVRGVLYCWETGNLEVGDAARCALQLATLWSSILGHLIRNHTHIWFLLPPYGQSDRFEEFLIHETQIWSPF